MMRFLPKSLTALVATIALLGLHTVPAGAQAETETTHVNVPVSGILPLECFGEDVAFSGTVSGVEHTTRDAAGQSHSVGHAGHLTATGVGLSTGTEYILRGGTQDTAGVFAPDGPTAITTVFTVQYISKGAGPDYRMIALLHLTRTATGDVVVDVDRVLRDDCR